MKKNNKKEAKQLDARVRKHDRVDNIGCDNKRVSSLGGRSASRGSIGNNTESVLYRYLKTFLTALQGYCCLRQRIFLTLTKGV